MWKPGESGNPGGRPRVIADVRTLAQKHTRQAIETLVKLLNARSEMVRTVAANSLLDRAVGRPAQAITGPDGGPIQLEAVRVAEEVRGRLVRLVTEGDVGGAALPPHGNGNGGSPV